MCTLLIGTHTEKNHKNERMAKKKASTLTWTLYSCCQFFAHAHRIWHRRTAPMCNSIAYRLLPSRLVSQLHLVSCFDFQFLPSQCLHDSDRLLARTDTSVAKIAAKTVEKEERRGSKSVSNKINWNDGNQFIFAFYSFCKFYLLRLCTQIKIVMNHFSYIRSSYSDTFYYRPHDEQSVYN